MTKYLSPKEIAAALSIHRRDVYRLIQKLPHVRIGRRIRVDEHELAAFLASKAEQPWAESTDARKTAATTATGSTRSPANDTSEASPLETEPSPRSDYAKPSWLRPLRRVGGGKG